MGGIAEERPAASSRSDVQSSPHGQMTPYSPPVEEDVMALSEGGGEYPLDAPRVDTGARC